MGACIATMYHVEVCLGFDGWRCYRLLSSLSISDPKQWVFHMCTNIPEEVGIRILITCWAIWHARRKAIHEGKFQSPLATMGAINRLINELQISNELKGWNSSKRDIGKRTHTWIPMLTQNRTNTLECARTRRRLSKRSEPAEPWRTGLTGSTDRSDRCGAENREDL